MKLASDWTEVAGVSLGLLAALGLRLHWTCNVRRCWRRELSPTGYCWKHQRR